MPLNGGCIQWRFDGQSITHERQRIRQRRRPFVLDLGFISHQKAPPV